MSFVSKCASFSSLPNPAHSTRDHHAQLTCGRPPPSMSAPPPSPVVGLSRNRLRSKSRRLQGENQRAPRTTCTIPDDSEAFERVVKSRYTNKVFDKTRAIPDGVLEKCLALCARAPTGFNTQPYIAIIVDDDQTKEALSKCMLGAGNITRILNAPATVVFAADNNCMRKVPKVKDVWLKDGAPEAFVQKQLPLYIALFSNGFGYSFGKIPFLGSLFNLIAFIVRKIVLSIASFFVPVPTPSTAETWSMKNSIFPAAFFLLAASAAGLATATMEGLDSRRMRSALNLPANYSIPCVIAVGYAPEPVDSRTSRFPTQELFFHNTYGQVFPGIPTY